jgi:hypothetical protein
MATTTFTGTYRILPNPIGTGFVIEDPTGLLLRDNKGVVRAFTTRNAARKRISREKSGNFHA